MPVEGGGFFVSPVWTAGRGAYWGIWPIIQLDYWRAEGFGRLINWILCRDCWGSLFSPYLVLKKVSYNFDKKYCFALISLWYLATVTYFNYTSFGWDLKCSCKRSDLMHERESCHLKCKIKQRSPTSSTCCKLFDRLLSHLPSLRAAGNWFWQNSSPRERLHTFPTSCSTGS